MANFFDYYDEEYDELDIHALFAAEEALEAEKKRKSTLLEHEPAPPKPKRSRLTYQARDSTTCQWYIDYVIDEHGTWGNPDHRDGKRFRRRFFFSLSAVRELTRAVKESGIWPRSEVTGPTRPNWVKPLALLVLGALRHVTRNLTLDDLSECTFISENVFRDFFYKFFSWYSSVLFPLFVCLPEMEAVKENGLEYERAGFPNTLCSVDGVHMYCWGVSANLKQFATGKEKRPTRGFNVSVNRRGLIVSCTKGFYGSIGDRTTIRFDTQLQQVADGKYEEYETQIWAYAEDGTTIIRETLRGVHAYLRQRISQVLLAHGAL